MSPRTACNRVTLASVSALCLIYIVLVVRLNQTRAFWSPDCGARFAMIRSWLQSGSLIHWPYSSAPLDPQGQIHPLAYFLFHQAHGWCAMYSPLFPLLSGVMYRLFGFGGLCIIPVLCGLGTVWIIAITARRLELRCHAFVPVVVGLGTPVLIYSVVFWDHIVMILLTAVAGYGMLRAIEESRPRFAAMAGAALGIGVWIHELLIAVFLAALLASIPLLYKQSGRRVVTGLLIGFVPPAALWTVGNEIIYGSFGGPHLAANMGGNVTDHPFSLGAVLSAPGLVDRILTELLGTSASGMMITNAHIELFPCFIFFGFLLFAYIATTWFFGAEWPPASILWLAAAVVALYLVIQVHWANGLFQATPLLIAALAVPWDAERESDGRRRSKNGRVADGGRRTEDGGKSSAEARRPAEDRGEDLGAEDGGKPTVATGAEVSPAALFYAWASRASWFYIIILLINPMLPGVDWGARYLLPVLPLLAILSLRAFEDQYSAAGRVWRRVVAVCAIAVVGLSVISQCEGLVTIQRSMRYNRDLINHALRAKAPAIVYSNIGTGAEMTFERLPKLQFMVRTTDDLSLLLRVLRARRVDEFTYVTNEQGPGPFEPLDTSVSYQPAPHSPDTERLVEKGSQALHIDPAREDGDPVQFVRYVIEQDHPAITRTK